MISDSHIILYQDAHKTRKQVPSIRFYGKGQDGKFWWFFILPVHFKNEWTKFIAVLERLRWKYCVMTEMMQKVFFFFFKTPSCFCTSRLSLGGKCCMLWLQQENLHFLCRGWCSKRAQSGQEVRCDKRKAWIWSKFESKWLLNMPTVAGSPVPLDPQTPPHGWFLPSQNSIHHRLLLRICGRQ